jgi:NTP pyrophosphatase (non-canonical NTP hydrolase)
MGISGEAGELVDAIKKSVMYRKPLDMEHVIEEMGDLEFYLEGLRQQLGITREQTLDANMLKLGARYSSGSYSDSQAVTRADKA